MVSLDNVQPNIVTSNLTDKIWLFYGEMATRKTSVACSFPNHLLLAFDIGYKFINGAMAVPLQSWSDFKQAVKQLDKQSNKDKYKVIVVDTIGMAYQACYQYMLTQMGVSEPGEAGAFGMGWKKIRNEFETTVRSIVQKGYGLVMIAHSDEVEREDKVKKTKVMGVKIDIDKRPDLIIKGLADFVLYLHKEVRDGTDTPTVYAYSELVDIDTKSRSRWFNRRFEFTYENLQHELEAAVAQQYQAEGLTPPTGDIVVTNPYATTAPDFTTLVQDTKNLASLLLDTGYATEVEQTLLSIFKGEALSALQENDENINKLQVAYTTLSDLRTKARV